MRSALLAILSTSMATALAILLIPDDTSTEGALFYPALVMSAGLATAAVFTALRYPKALLRGESLLSFAPIYWLLLDLLQGVYRMQDITADQVRLAFLSIGIFVVMVRLGALRRSWKIPKMLISSVSQEFSVNTYFALAIACFALGMLNFAVPCNFNIFEMVHYLGQERWAAPWGRGQLGGWDAFLDHLQYFGYLLPVLTVVIGRRAGVRNIRTLICIGMSVIMALFLAQSGSRRVIGVVAGMALILGVDTVAGLASMLKVILSMTHGQIPPTIGVEAPLSSGRMGTGQIVSKLTPWPDGPRVVSTRTGRWRRPIRPR